MKSVLAFIFIISMSLGATAQISIQDEVTIIQSLYKLSKKEIVSQALQLEAGKAQVFWPIYEKYELERMALGKRKIEIILAYAMHIESMDNMKAGVIAGEYLKNSQAYEKLFAKYFKQTKKKLGALEAAKWLQLESYLHTQIKAEMQNDMPFIFEIDKQFRKSKI
jgi:hypothetical protein